MSHHLQISQLEAQIETLQRRLDEAETRAVQGEAAAARATIESHFRVAAVEADVIPGAIPDVINPAIGSGAWKIDSQGKVYRQTADGGRDVDIHGNDISPTSWLKSLRKELPNYFKDNQSLGLKDQIMRDTPNPWTAKHWNITDQAKIVRSSSEIAKRMADAAGVDVNATRPAEQQTVQGGR